MSSMPLRPVARRAAFWMTTAVLVACSVSCTYPRVSTFETQENLPPETHVIGKFLRSEKSYSSAELARLMELEFMQRRHDAFAAHMLEIGASCERTPRQTICVYKHQTPSQMYVPWTFGRRSRTMKVVSIRTMQVTATSAGDGALEEIGAVNARITQSGHFPGDE